MTALIAAVFYQGGFAIDELMTRAAERLRAEGVSLGGAVQENLRNAADVCAAMMLIELKSRQRFSISQDLGSKAQGCRLDAAGLADIGAVLERSIGRDIDLMILNRFGVAEAEGRGLRAIFARAIESGIPVLTAVRPPYTEAWAEFHGGMAVDLPPRLDAVLGWSRDAIGWRRATLAADLTSVSPA